MTNYNWQYSSRSQVAIQAVSALKLAGNYWFIANPGLTAEVAVQVQKKYTTTAKFWFDLKFEATKTTGENLKLISINTVWGDSATPTDFGLCFEISYTATVINWKVYSYPSMEVIDFIKLVDDSNSGSHEYRVCFFENAISVYVDDSWKHTTYIPNIVYSINTNILSITSSNAQTIADVCLSELSENRSAIYVDIESPAFNAIGSVIQERPIEMYSRSDGGVDFTYKRSRVSLSIERLTNFKKVESIPTDTGSDILVYSADVQNIIDLKYAREIGWSTKMFRLPQLTYGASDVARTMAKNSLQRRYTYSFRRGRPDMRFELGDILVFADNDPLTGFVSTERVIIESLNLQHNERGTEWSGSGRNAEQ